MKLRIGLLIPNVLLHWVKPLMQLYKLEKKYGDPNVPLRTRVWLWKNGFCSWHKGLYQLSKQNIHKYLTTRDHFKLHPLNGAYTSLIDNKAFLPLIVDFVPSVYIVFENGVERYRKGISAGDLYNDIEDFISNGGEFVIKPLCATGGSGFHLIHSNELRDVVRTKVMKKESFIIQDKVIQHDYSSTIYPDSVNTIRIVLFRDIYDRRIKLAGTSHRFGTDQSKPVDNLGKGGILTSIDSETGMLGQSFIYEGTQNAGWHVTHPNTGATIENVQIPAWKEKINMIINIFDRISWFEYGGLDVVFTKDSFVILEINSMPHVDIIQTFKPYLEDVRLKEFFVSKGLKIKKQKSF